MPASPSLGDKVIKWFGRNYVLLVSGIVLLPLALYALLMFTAFASGFFVDKSIYATVVMWLVGIYPLVFLISVKLSVRSYALNGDYAYWDFLPISYFFTVFVIMFWGKF